jgi:hypothetical protein
LDEFPTVIDVVECGAGENDNSGRGDVSPETPGSIHEGGELG